VWLVKSTLAMMAVSRHLGLEAFVEIRDDKNLSLDSSDKVAIAKLPNPAQIQLFSIALERYQHWEAKVCQEIDRLVFGKRENRSWDLGSSCSDPLILGL
jgi:transcriptional regulator of aromatic amino acid metabolism